MIPKKYLLIFRDAKETVHVKASDDLEEFYILKHEYISGTKVPYKQREEFLKSNKGDFETFAKNLHSAHVYKFINDKNEIFIIEFEVGTKV